jgi:hypothetical protein
MGWRVQGLGRIHPFVLMLLADGPARSGCRVMYPGRTCSRVRPPKPQLGACAWVAFVHVCVRVCTLVHLGSVRVGKVHACALECVGSLRVGRRLEGRRRRRRCADLVPKTIPRQSPNQPLKLCRLPIHSLQEEVREGARDKMELESGELCAKRTSSPLYHM